eukprot:1007433_1
MPISCEQSNIANPCIPTVHNAMTMQTQHTPSMDYQSRNSFSFFLFLSRLLLLYLYPHRANKCIFHFEMCFAIFKLHHAQSITCPRNSVYMSSYPLSTILAR